MAVAVAYKRPCGPKNSDSLHFSLVYLLFPTFRETLQGGFLEVFNVLFRQFSVYFPDKFSGENRRKSLFSLLKSFSKPFKRPNKPVSLLSPHFFSCFSVRIFRLPSSGQSSSRWFTVANAHAKLARPSSLNSPQWFIWPFKGPLKGF